MAEENSNRTNLINIISKPVQLVALVVLVVEGLLAYLVTKANPEDIKLYVCLMVGVLVVTIIIYFVFEYKQRNNVVVPPIGQAENTKQVYEWDVFLASPMAALSNDDFKKATLKINEIKNVLELDCGFKRVFYAGSKMLDSGDFEPAAIAIETDLEALKNCQYFIMIYPDKIVSSVLYEAGIALALGKPSFYFGERTNFPFLMQEANQKFNHIKIYEAGTHDDVIRLLKQNKSQLFKI